MPIPALRTPAERFVGLPDFPYTAQFDAAMPGFEGLRMAFLDEGDPSADVVLCLHGEPTWSYLYRKMIPVFTDAGFRVVAPDLFGFGQSDKPTDKSVYTYHFHRNALMAFIERLDLRRITLVCQDWGGILGLSLPMDMAGRFERLLVMNTALPIEPGTSKLSANVFSGEAPKSGFAKWRDYALRTPDIPVGAIVQSGCEGRLTPAEIAAYDAPFPDVDYKLCAHHFPALVPLNETMPGYAEGRRAITFWNSWQKPAFMALGDADKVIPPPAMEALRREIAGCSDPYIVKGGGHFLQEWGDEVASAALSYFSAC